MAESDREEDTAPRGCLILIGGGEDRDPAGQRSILREIAGRVRGGKLVLATIASQEPEGYLEDYQRAFADLGIGELIHLYVSERSEAGDFEKVRALDDAAGIFFSGGDQLRIISQIGDSGIEAKVRSLYQRGGVVAGTSAGAAVMSENMLVRGSSSVSHRIGDVQIAPGLGLIRDVIVDQHFAQRGRFGRLMGAVALNSRELGLGIDEDTAVIVEGDHFEVLGSGAAYVVDGSTMTYNNISEEHLDRVLSMHTMTVHILGHGDRFDLATRRPVHLHD